MPGLLELVGGSAIYNAVKDAGRFVLRKINGTGRDQLEKQAK